jgi:hypothetical protein
VKTPHESEIDIMSNDPDLVDFVREFDSFLCLYKQLEAVKRTSLGEHLFKVGTQIKGGKKFWTKTDLNAIMRWKRLQPLQRRIEQGSAQLEQQLRFALMADKEDRVGALCRIPGFGPVLACAVLTLTWPETYGILDNTSWHALGFLGFDLPPKAYSGGGFTVAEAEQYQHIIRTLGRITSASPVHVADALHAFYKTRNRTRNSRRDRIAAA